jgi:hypothetical protein
MLATSYRSLGDADDIVQGFFADRLDRTDFFTKWQESGKRLRYWLINAFLYFLQESVKRKKRDGKYVELPEEPTGRPEIGPDEAIDWLFAALTVRRALDETQNECQKRGLVDHFKVFELHDKDGIPYSELLDRFEVTEIRAACMARTARSLFKETLRSFYRKEGATESEIDREIEELMQLLSRMPGGHDLAEEGEDDEEERGQGDTTENETDDEADR